jgi:hypothetical protein
VSGAGSSTGLEPGAGLRFVVMMVVGVVMVVRLGEGRGRNQHQEQGCEDNLFHGLRVAPGELRESLWAVKNLRVRIKVANSG